MRVGVFPARYYVTRTDGLIKQHGLHTRIAAQPKLALSRLSIRLGVPNYADQEILVDRFTAFSEETQRLESVYRQKLDAL
jgi:hypothetical protein